MLRWTNEVDWAITAKYSFCDCCHYNYCKLLLLLSNLYMSTKPLKISACLTIGQWSCDYGFISCDPNTHFAPFGSIYNIHNVRHYVASPLARKHMHTPAAVMYNKLSVFIIIKSILMTCSVHACTPPKNYTYASARAPAYYKHNWYTNLRQGHRSRLIMHMGCVMNTKNVFHAEHKREHSRTGTHTHTCAVSSHLVNYLTYASFTLGG